MGDLKGVYISCLIHIGKDRNPPCKDHPVHHIYNG